MSENTYSAQIAQAVSDFLTEDDWKFGFEEDAGIFKMSLSIGGKLKSVNMFIDIGENDFVVYAYSPVGVDADDGDRMADMAEFICRANYGLKNGNFEFDMRDGSVRYKCFVDCSDGVPGTDVIKSSVICPGSMFNIYSEGIAGVIFGILSPGEAIEKCESGHFQ